MKFENPEPRLIGNAERVPPVFKNEHGKYIIINKDEYFTSSYWEFSAEIPKGAKRVKLSVKAHTDTPNGKIIPAVIQCGKLRDLSGEYMLNSREDTYECEIIPLNNARKIRLELMFYSYGEGRAEFSFPEATAYNKDVKRVVTVATAYFKRSFKTDCAENMKTITGIIDKAAKDKNKPDILCFTETSYDRGINCSDDKKFISDDSAPVKEILKKAKEHKMHIIFGFHEKDDKNNYYNTVVIISDKGKIIGKYRKTHLCYNEIKKGMIPGNDLPVFDLPFGRVGLLICWDQWFPEAARELVAKGAEIIFISTAGNPTCLTMSRARENGVYVVASGAADDPGASFITDRHGDIIARSGEENECYASASIDLAAHEYIRWLSFERGHGADLYKVDRQDNLYNYYNR